MFPVHPYGEDVVKGRPFVLSVLPEPCHYNIKVNTIFQHHLCSCYQAMSQLCDVQVTVWDGGNAKSIALAKDSALPPSQTVTYTSES